MKEEWKEVPNYNGMYFVSNYGRIKSFHSGQQKILSPRSNWKGYKGIVLHLNGVKTFWAVHRLVATLFIPNPNNYPCVNHKDNDVTNNNVDNLEWCTYYYNNTYNNRHKKYAHKTAIKLGKRIEQYDINGKLIANFISINEASKTLNIPYNTLRNHLDGKEYKGYIYKIKTTENV